MTLKNSANEHKNILKEQKKLLKWTKLVQMNLKTQINSQVWIKYNLQEQSNF